MHTSIRRTAAVPAVVAALAIALTAFAAPVLAKEALDAQLEAPIARDTPGGTTLLVGVWLTMTDETGTHDVDGSPVYVRMTGPDGGSTVARATQTRPGHYAARITVPASGVKAVEVGMDGSTSSPFNLVGFTIVPGSISARTAQVAPPEPVAIAPVARASVAGAARRSRRPPSPAVDPATTVTPAAAPVDAGPGPLILGAARPGGRGHRDAGHRPPRPDRRPPAAVRPVARGLTPSCSRVRRKSRRPPRRPSFGAPRPATRRRTGSW